MAQGEEQGRQRSRRSIAQFGETDADLDDYVQPPYQLRKIEMLYLAGTLPDDAVAALLPAELTAAPGNICVLQVFDVPEGWGIAPFTAFASGICVAGHDAPDGSEGIFQMAATYTTGRASRILKRDFNDLFDAGQPVFERRGGVVYAASAFGRGGTAFIEMRARRQNADWGSQHGSRRYLGLSKDGALIHYSVSYTLDRVAADLELLRFDFPSGHPLKPLEAFQPTWVGSNENAVFTYGVPEIIGTGSLAKGGWSTGEVQAALTDLISRMGRPAVVVERAGRVVFANVQAEALLGRHVRGEPLAIGRAADKIRLRTALDRSVERRHDVNGQLVILDRQDSSPLIAQVFPIHRAIAEEPAALVLLTDPEWRGMGDPANILELMGLTPAEARVATLVGQGRPPKKAADELHIALSTLRSTMRSVYSKLGLRRQADLAKFVTHLDAI